MKKKLLIASLFVVFITGAAFVTDEYFEVSKNLEIFANVFKEVNTTYVDEVEPGKLMRTGIDAMLNSLDPYTNYFSEAETEDYRIQTTGQYGGIGASTTLNGDYQMVTDVYEGYAAQKMDLRPGDYIIEVDGKSVKNFKSSDIGHLLKGPAGTDVKLQIKRENEYILKTLKREDVKLKNVPYYGMINDKVGYIKLSGFMQDAGKEVADALTDLKKNPSMNSVILDLRGNPGGLLHEAVNIVNCFVDKNLLTVTTRGKSKDAYKEYFTLNNPVDRDIPLIVITNRNSASASEIVSGSLQDFDRGVILGQRTFGKGLVQTPKPLPFNTQIKVTTAKYYIPSGRCIQALDYTHRNEDGSVGKVPDSLMHEFKTKAGRTVKDGGGVKPDVETEMTKMSPILQALYTKNLIFNFANDYRNSHATIASSREFKLSDADWNNFVQYISDKDYEYTTETEKELAQMKKKAEEEKYFDAIKADYESLKKKLAHDKKSDVDKAKNEIIEQIELEITRRYYYQKANVEATFDDDRDIKAALDLFNDMPRFNNMLKKK